MAESSGYVLRLSPERMRKFLQNRNLYESFAEPVGEFLHKRGAQLVCFIQDYEGITRFVALGRRGVRAGTGLRRLNVSSIEELEESIQLEAFAPRIPSRMRHGYLTRVRSGGLFTPTQFRALADALTDHNEDLNRLVARFATSRAERIAQIPANSRHQLAFQKDAVGIALTIAGIDRQPLVEWEPPFEGSPTSFVAGLPQVRLREDTMIFNDMRILPGFSEIESYVHGGSVFENEQGDKVTIVIANRQPLEELSGADLVYYNETFEAFVMVQYKAMERFGEDSIFRLPNTQLDTEIDRMEKVLTAIQNDREPTGVDGYRLLCDPFFVKLCPRVVLQPDDVGLVPGMYIPLGKLRLLQNSDVIVHATGSKGVTYSNTRRYFNNTAFVGLVAKAWVGTTPAQSKLLMEAVRLTLESGRAAVIAVRRVVHRNEEVEQPLQMAQ